MRVFLFLAVFTASLFSCALCGGAASLVSVSTNTVLSGSTIQKLEVSWKFDEQLSKLIIALYDRNKNQKFDTNEIAEMFDVLSKSEKPKFMLVVGVNNVNRPDFRVENFNANIKSGRVIYNFSVMLGYPLGNKNKFFYYFVDTAGSLAFVHSMDTVNITNSIGYKTNKSIGFRVVQDTMSVINLATIDINK
ncbi:MAG: DUF1007 family protein [Campylobacterales bacterium]